jgi:hypothetical protein
MMTKLPLQAQQLLNLLLLLVVGKSLAHIYLSWGEIVGVLFFTLSLEHFLLYLQNKKLTFFSYSSSTTAIGVMLMMLTTHYWIYFFVITLALLQKYFLRFEGGHLFNPSNFALIVALFLFYNEAHIVLGQLGDDGWFLAIVLGIGIFILGQAKRWVIAIVFMLGYLFFQYTLIVLSDPLIIFEDIYERFYSISFIVFILFMLTDPRTTPLKGWEQGVFALCIAGVATCMDYWYGFRVQHLFLALFILSSFFGLSRVRNLFLPKNIFRVGIVLILVSSVIIFIQMQAPYYFEMDG